VKGESHVKRKRRSYPNNLRGLQLPSDFKTYLREVSPHRQNQRNQGGKGLEGAQIRIGSVSKRRECKMGLNLVRYEETMEGSLNDRERRRYPRISIDLPLEFQYPGDADLRGAIVVNVSEGGFLIESTRDIPVGTKLSITLLFPKGFELANLKAVTKIVRKEPYRKEDWEGNQYWEGYQSGLEFIQISDEDRWKLNCLLGGRFEIEEISPSLSCQL
jgi:hypothetical protein